MVLAPGREAPAVLRCLCHPGGLPKSPGCFLGRQGPHSTAGAVQPRRLTPSCPPTPSPRGPGRPLSTVPSRGGPSGIWRGSNRGCGRPRVGGGGRLGAYSRAACPGALPHSHTLAPGQGAGARPPPAPVPARQRLRAPSCRGHGPAATCGPWRAMAARFNEPPRSSGSSRCYPCRRHLLARTYTLASAAAPAHWPRAAGRGEAGRAACALRMRGRQVGVRGGSRPWVDPEPAFLRRMRACCAPRTNP